MRQRLIRSLALALVCALLLAGCVPVSLLTADPPEPTEPYPPLLPGYNSFPTPEQQAWALATCAVLTEQNGHRTDLLGGLDPMQTDVQGVQANLSKWWGIENRTDLLGTLEWLEHGGHRREFDEYAEFVAAASPSELEELQAKASGDPASAGRLSVVILHGDQLGEKSIAAWDLGRYVWLCGQGYLAGYVASEEAWAMIMPAAIAAQSTFDSWEDFGTNYVIGREYWLPDAGDDASWQRARAAHEKLSTDPASPWLTIPWDLELDQR